MTPREAKYAVVIQTNSYAGNFEREMCAHITGCIGECEVGKEYVDEEIQKKFEKIVIEEPDDNGCYRPVTLGCYIKGFKNTDVVIFFDKKPSQAHIDIMKERLKTFNYQKVEIKGLQLLTFNKSVTKEKL
jgi:hypothetical protein